MMEPIVLQLLGVMREQMRNDARRFRHGEITRQEYERRCISRGAAPIDIEGFYKWSGSITSGEVLEK